MNDNQSSHRNRERCRKFTSMYQSKFQDIDYLTSDELIRMEGQREDENSNRIILVDVRTEPERQVSMLEGALTKEQFAQEVSNGDVPTDAEIVTYCTMGYRSGFEARRFRMQYPQFKDRIKSLDGIVAYTHALGDKQQQEQEQLEKDENSHRVRLDSPRHRRLYNPHTGQSTNRVHTFGAIWGFVDQRNFETTHFSVPELLLRLVQVSGSIVSVSFLWLKNYCCCGRGSTVEIKNCKVH